MSLPRTLPVSHVTGCWGHSSQRYLCLCPQSRSRCFRRILHDHGNRAPESGAGCHEPRSIWPAEVQGEPNGLLQRLELIYAPGKCGGERKHRYNICVELISDELYSVWGQVLDFVGLPMPGETNFLPLLWGYCCGFYLIHHRAPSCLKTLEVNSWLEIGTPLTQCGQIASCEQ